MNESSLASDSGEQETGIQVDMDSDDPGKSVTRARPRNSAKPAPAPDPFQRRMSADVKKRLDRMQRGFNQQLAEQQAEFQRQLAERDKRLEALKKGDDAPGADDAAHQAAMDALQEKLIDAQERGDSREVAKLTREMSSLDAKFWAAKAAKAGVVDKTNQPGAASQPTAAQPTGGAGQRQPTKAGVAWAKANGDWWNDTVDEVAIDARAYATSIHQRKLRDGEDPEDPMYFEEIGDMVKKRFPELDVKAAVRTRRNGSQIDDPDDADGEDDTIDDRQHRNPRRGAPPQIPNRGDPPRGSRNIQTLSQADIRTMREVGMNPDDNKHVVQFLRSKNEVEAES